MQKFTFSIIAALSLCLLPVLATGQTTNAMRLLDKDGKGIGSTAGSLDVQCANCSGGGTGLTDAQLRAAPIGVTGAFYQATQPVSGTFWQATQPVSGPLTDVQLRASPLSVTGTFFQATQPVSGTFWQTTQPVSGTFWQSTQPVSATALPLPSNAAQETGGNLATLAGKDFSTSAKQDVGNTALSAISANMPPVISNAQPVFIIASNLPQLAPLMPNANLLTTAARNAAYCRRVLCPPITGGLR